VRLLLACLLLLGACAHAPSPAGSEPAPRAPTTPAETTPASNLPSVAQGPDRFTPVRASAEELLEAQGEAAWRGWTRGEPGDPAAIWKGREALLDPAVLAQLAQASAAAAGSIVFISSPHAYQPIPRSMAYNMSKAAINMLARTAAIELVEHKIRVNVVTPGWVDTPGERKFASEETIARSGEKLPWKRLGQPAEIGRAVVFLCDPASDYITGSSLLVDGGITLPWWANRGSGVPA